MVEISQNSLEKKVWQLLEEVPDPEIPVLNILDLGIVRAVNVAADGGVEVVITPTYSGCPAMNMIEALIKMGLAAGGVAAVTVKTVLSPSWTTDWIKPEAKDKLRAFGIAPPQYQARLDKILFEKTVVPCPICDSTHTEEISAFGSTACKAMYRCLDCKEPFDYFKCH